VQAGNVVLGAGLTLRPGHLGMAAQLGRSQLMVTRRPTVGILSTGDELVEIDEPPSDETILNVNSHALAVQVLEAGAIPVRLGIARDTPEAIRAGIRAGLDCDLLLVSGGVSMGDFDFVKPVMDELGGGLDFWKVRIKPARPLAFGMIGGVPTFGLPGNPVSSMVSFELFVRPFLRRAMGHQAIDRPTVQARLTEPVRKKAGRRFFLRAVLERDAHGLTCRTTGPQGSGMLTSMMLADALMDLPDAWDGPLPAGHVVTLHIL
jgi:molybdopterin molybdotransferase